MDNYFSARRIIDIMDEILRPHGYSFMRWSVRGTEEEPASAWEITFSTPDMREATTGISASEVNATKHTLKGIATALAARILHRVDEDSK